MRSDGGPIDQARFAAACSTLGLVVSRVDLLFGGQPRGTLAVTGGQVTLDRSAGTFGRLSGLTVVADPEDLPTRQGGRLTPSGWEVQVWAGLRLLGQTATTLPVLVISPDGSYVLAPSGAYLASGTVAVPAGMEVVDALVPLGVFPLEASEVDAFGVVGVSAFDRSSVVAADLLTATLEWPGPFTTLEAAVEDLVRRTFPNVQCEFVGTPHPCPTLSHERDADPWRITKDAAASVGYFARFDGLGRFRWEPEPDLATAQPVAVFGDNAGLLDLNARVTSQDVHNGWTVVGANPATPDVEIVSTVVDDTPGSPTQWGGPYGRRPKPAVRMELVDSQAKADDAVRALRAAEIGFGVELDVSVVPNYLVEPGDAVHLRRDAAGVDGVALVDRQTIDLAPGTMSLGCRARQVVT